MISRNYFHLFSGMTASQKMTNNQGEAAANSFKEAGNECYKNGDVSGALENYTKAIEACEEVHDEKLMAICLKNRAAVFLKEEDFNSVIDDCTRYVMGRKSGRNGSKRVEKCRKEVEMGRSGLKWGEKGPNGVNNGSKWIPV